MPDLKYMLYVINRHKKNVSGQAGQVFLLQMSTLARVIKLR
jgi:hypothetical protein